MRLVCFGDSNTYGYDPRSFFGDRYGAEDRWVDLLAKKTGWETVNLGENGRTIPKKPCVIADPEDRVLIMLGTNNLLQGASAKETAAAMGAFLTALLPHCRNILLICPPLMRRGAWVATDALVEESVKLALEYEQLAKRLNIPYIDTRQWDIPLTFDGVHFTEAGHRAFAENLRKELRL